MSLKNKNKMSVVRLNLQTKKVITHNKKVRFSCYLPQHLKDILQKLDDDQWVLGVQYDEDNSVQVGITGTGILHENWKRTVTREMGEELKLYPKFNSVEDPLEYRDKKKDWYCCKINIDNTVPSSKQKFKQDNNINIGKRKIGVLVYGTFEKIMNNLKYNYDTYVPNDGITHIIMMKVGFIKSILPMFDNGRYFDMVI